MSRIKMKRLLILMMAVLLIPSAAQASETTQDIIDAAQLTPQQINYKTTEVRIGSFVKEANTNASEYYPLTYNVRFDKSNAKFVEYTVKRGDAVKAGDVLARFTITGSDVALTRLEMNLSRTKEETERGISDREEAIAKMRAEVAAESDAYEKEKKTISLRKLETELDRYRYRQQNSIDDLQEALDEERERRETNVLISPVDGIVSELSYKKIDDAISASETLVTISSEEVMLLRAKNSGDFRYNMPVQVVMGSSKQQVILTGRIVAADDAIPESERTGYVFIQMDPYDTEEYKLRSPKIVADTIRVDDVLLIQRTAATLEAGKYYVTKLVDGMVQKRYIQFGMSNVQDIWVLNGVTEGETLVID